VPDREWGKKVVAFVIVRKGQSVGKEELKNFLNARLSAFTIPKEYVKADELPKSPQGKILRKEVRKIYGKSGMALQ
jgi:acyl-coenzyme A synthetase/AMP-(fatty) acid ligase